LEQICDDNKALKRCKLEFIEEDKAALQQLVSALEVVVRCSICSDTMNQASTASGCGHTFCSSCIQEAVRLKGCCPSCKVPLWQRDIRNARGQRRLSSIATTLQRAAAGPDIKKSLKILS
jgi:hypothetical protein